MIRLILQEEDETGVRTLYTTRFSGASPLREIVIYTQKDVRVISFGPDALRAPSDSKKDIAYGHLSDLTASIRCK